MARKRESFDSLLVRSSTAKSRGDLAVVYRELRAPFAGAGPESQDSTTQETFELPPAPGGRWVIAARFPKQDWFPVSCNCADASRILEANQSPRLQFARFGHDSESDRWFFEIWKSGKPIFRYQYDEGTEKPTLRGPRADQAVAADGKPGAAAIKRLRSHFEIQNAVRTVQQADGKLVVVSERGKQLSPKVCGLVAVKGPAIAGDESKASSQLAKAIEQRMPQGIRDALAAGASLQHLPDTSLSPLHIALLKCDKPRGQECAEILVEAGADTTGLVSAFFANYIDPALTLKILQVLIAHGADVDQTTKGGQTALFQAVMFRQVEAAELLMAHGADPHIKALQGTPIEWAEKKFGQQGNHSQKADFARLLEIMTGQPVELPDTKPASERLQLERIRFDLARKARIVAEHLPTEIEIHPSEANRVAKHRNFTSWEKQLVDAGFQPAGFFKQLLYEPIDIAAYSNPKLQLDAVVSERFVFSRLGCQILGYGADQRYAAAINFEDPDDPDLHPSLLLRLHSLKSPPKKLVAQMQKFVKQHDLRLTRVSPEKFVDNYQAAYMRILSATRDRAREVLADPALVIQHDGQPARFERLHVYLNFRGYDDPSYSTATMAQGNCEQLAEAREPHDAFQAEMAIRDALELQIMRHLQFAGAPQEEQFLQQGCELAATWATNLGGPWKSDLYERKAGTLEQGLLLCQIAGDEKRFRTICEKVPPQVASPKLASEAGVPLPYSRMVMVIASSFRKRKLSNFDELEAAVAKGPPRVKALLAAWKAIAGQNEKQLAAALSRALKHFRKQEPHHNENHLLSRVAIAESILANLARGNGMQLGLSQEDDDLLILAGRS